jgi:DNA-binding GntR family transcriptional regulator
MPIPSRAQKLERPLARNEAYERIHTWIVEGKLTPGERLQDTALALALGVSRMPVREALLRLQSEGLIESLPNRWIRVSAVSPDQGEELYPLIWAIESLALRLGHTALTAADISMMDKANERLARALEAGKGQAASQADADFHGVFVNSAGNRELIRLLDDLKLRLRRLEVAYFAGCLNAAESVGEHMAIIKALRTNDLEAAVVAVESNWRRSLSRYRIHIRESASVATLLATS